MFLLNLTPGQFLGLLAGGAALVLALYLLDRSRRRLVVATLRFWTAAREAPQARRRRRIQQWPSLLLQLAGLALLLAALGGLHWGSPGPAARDHVLILETSAWMAARTAQGTLMEQARALARYCVRALPARDRVMLVRADALATPATAFENDRAILERAIADSAPSATALRLQQALALAARTQRWRGGSPGEILFVGSGRVLAEESEDAFAPPANLRVITAGGPLENCGLRRIGLERSVRDPGQWNIFVVARNYGTAPQRRRIRLEFGGAPVGSEEFHLAPGAEQSLAFRLRTQAAGWLTARLEGRDALAADDEATLELPALRLLRVLVYSRQPELLRPLLAANPWVRAEYRSPAQYQPDAAADLVLVDGFRPPAPPRGPALWIEPPAAGSPVPVAGRARAGEPVRWRPDHPVTEGLGARDLRLEGADVYSPSAGDAVVAEVEQGPVVVARSGPPKVAVLGFHPGRSRMRYELAAPLLVANILRWIEPEVFRRWEAHAQSAGSVSAELPEGAQERVRVLTEDGRAVPFTQGERGVRFFWAEPGLIRVFAGAGEMVYSLSLPQVAEAQWTPPAAVRRGLPPAAAAETRAADLSPWLALGGALCILVEWLLYGASGLRVAGRGGLRWARLGLLSRGAAGAGGRGR